MLEEKSAIGWNLRAVAPRIFTADDNRTTLRMRSGQISQRQCIGGDMRADAFERDDGPARHHLTAVDGRDAQRFIVGLESANPLGLEQIGDVPHAVEKSRHRRAGIPRQQMHAPFALQSAFHQQFVAGKDFRAVLYQKTRITSHEQIPFIGSRVQSPHRAVQILIDTKFTTK